MNLLVTGGAGFIGANFVRYWLEEHPDDNVVVLDLLTYAGVRENVPEGVPLVEGDIGDGELVERTLQEHAIDVVVNFAAESHNSYAVLDPGRFFRTNVLGTQTLLEAARRVGIEPLPPRLDLRGLRRPAARQPGIVQRGVAVRAAHAVQRVEGGRRPRRARVLRDVRPAGDDHELLEQLRAAPVPGEGRSRSSSRTRSTTSRCRSTRRPRTGASGCTSTTTAARSSAVLERGRVGETYNVGSGLEASIEEIADRILELTGKPAELKSIVPDRPGHDRRYLLDSSKLRDGARLGARGGVRRGLAATVEWYAANRDWWEPLKERAPVVGNRLVLGEV